MGRPKITKPLDDILREDFSYDPIEGIVYRDGIEFGTYDSRGYLIGTVKRKCLKVHRIAWFLYYGDWPKYGIDHINRVKDDNRICNLRDVTQAVNLRNVGLRANNKSGYKNVSWDKTKGKWIARKRSQVKNPRQAFMLNLSVRSLMSGQKKVWFVVNKTSKNWLTLCMSFMVTHLLWAMIWILL